MPLAPADELLARLAHGPAVRISVAAVQGSGPRDAGTWMAVWADACLATIGGGHLEFAAIDHARRLLSGEALETTRRFALGPSLGQCCGGVVHLHFELLTAQDVPSLRLANQEATQQLLPVALFGGGHVGRAIVAALQPLPVRVHWVDSREEIFPPGLSARVQTEHSEPVQAAVAMLAPQSRVLIMSFSHAEDLDVLAACLARLRAHNDLPFIGLIGSRSKWAVFQHRLLARGFTEAELARVTCPIGVAGVHGKEPEVIAVAVAAQLMQQR